jgi:hypothetical protein
MILNIEGQACLPPFPHSLHLALGRALPAVLGVWTLTFGRGPSILILEAYTFYRVDIVSERLGVWKRFVVAIPNTVLGYIAYITPRASPPPLPHHPPHLKATTRGSSFVCPRRI